ncbi:MAG TPA: COX15/CtaA family protein [Microbacteriaceae bacterium]|nr:COX15/CtaA family protein [Microbacteriaceae bacterium]
MHWVRTAAWLNLIGNLVIIATGGAVRLTASGLGCDQWPLCTTTSLVPGIDEGIHGIIEFSNRTMSGVLGIFAVLAIVAVWRFRHTRKDLWVHAWIILAGVVIQAVIGGIVVLTRLSVSTVGIHYVVSAVLVGVTASFLVRAYREPGPRERAVPRWVAIATHVSSLLLALVVLGGVVTTQNGPHSGDAEVIRDSSAWDALVHVHAWLGYALCAALVVLLVGGIVARARSYIVAVVLLMLTVAVQIAVGVIQARIGIPPLLVGIHMVLAGVSVAFGVLVVDRLKRPAREVGADGPSGAG